MCHREKLNDWKVEGREGSKFSPAQNKGGTMKQPITIGRVYGSLTVARFLDDGMIFSTCSCGSSRTTTRAQLGKSIRACQKCADKRRREAGGRRPEPPLPPEPEPVRTQEAKCTGKVVDGWLRCDATECPKHGIHAVGWPRQVDTRIYPATVI